ncbi:hypothetical protein ACX818_001428 [Acinetobacter baumannii]
MKPDVDTLVKIAECYANKSKSAAKRKLEFNMSLVSFSNIKMQTHCAYSGLPFTEEDPLSLERIDNSIGYIDGNVVPVLKSLNETRGNRDLKDIDSTIESINEKIKNRYSTITCRAQKIELLYNEYNRLLSGNVKQFKPVLNSDFYKKWIILATNVENATKEINSRKIIIDQYTAKLTGSKSKKQVQYKNTIANLKTKIAHYDKQITNNVNGINNLFKKCKKVESTGIRPASTVKLDKILADIAENEECIALNRERILEANKVLERWKILRVALEKFENLTDGDRERIKLGLPLDTGTFKVLKHKLSYNNLINQI